MGEPICQLLSTALILCNSVSSLPYKGSNYQQHFPKDVSSSHCETTGDRAPGRGPLSHLLSFNPHREWVGASGSFTPGLFAQVFSQEVLRIQMQLKVPKLIQHFSSAFLMVIHCLSLISHEILMSVCDFKVSGSMLEEHL